MIFNKKSPFNSFCYLFFVAIMLSSSAFFCQSEPEPLQIRFSNQTGMDLKELIAENLHHNFKIANLANQETSEYISFEEFTTYPLIMAFIGHKGQKVSNAERCGINFDMAPNYKEGKHTFIITAFEVEDREGTLGKYIKLKVTTK